MWNGPDCMRQLTIQGVFWCWRHGHPVATLAANDGGSPLSISLATDDAQALSPLYRGHSAGRSRTYDLLEGVVAVLGGRLIGVLLGAAPGGSPEAALSLEGPFGIHTVPAHVVDAVVIAWRHDLPLHVDDRTLRHLRHDAHADATADAMDMAMDMDSDTDADITTELERQDTGRTAAGEPFADAPLPEAMRTFINSLDLGGLGG